MVPAAEIWLVDDVPVAAPERTVFDCLLVLPDAAATAVIEHAVIERLASLDDLSARLHHHVGRRGAPRLARLIHQAAAGARSAGERLAITLLRRAGITGWVANQAITDERGLIGLGDIVFADHRLVLEIDGRAHHITPDRFQRDRDRQNRLVAAGWRVLRFTWSDLTLRPDQVLASVRAMLAVPLTARSLSRYERRSPTVHSIRKQRS